MRTRNAYVDLAWNGAAVTSKIAGMVTSISYTDPASGEADSIDISIQDRDRKWTSSWMPSAGDTLSAKIKLQDWEREGDNRSLYCGFFILDDFSFAGWPITGSISGVSVPADGAFRETERSKTWENVTIKEIATEIAGRAKIALLWDANGFDWTIKSIEQSSQTDCDFLMSLCSTYGLSMKVYVQKIVIFDREAYKAKKSAMTLCPSDIESWSWKTTLAGTYTGGEYTYTDPITEEEIVAKVGDGPRILKQSGKADSVADAERKIKAAVNNAHHGAVSMSVTMMGNARLFAGQCITISGLGRLSGKYYIDKVTHSLGGGYTMQLDLSKV
jgi:phage protein D